MKTWKGSRFLALLLVMIVAVTMLAACAGNGPAGSGGNAGDTDADKNNNAPADTQTDTQTAAPVKLSFWTTPMDEITQGWWKKWTDEFNKSHPEIQVKVEFIPDDAWDQRMKASQAAGTAPDIKIVNYNKIAFASKQGELTALDEYMEPAVWDDLFENINDFVSVGDKHYAYPMLVEPSSVLYYRKDYFEEAGLDPSKPPVTWDELIEYGKKLATKGRYGLLAAGNDVELGWTHWGLQGMVGQRPISDDWSEATINNDAYKQLITLWKQLYEENILPKQAPSPYNDIKSFAEGRSGMAISGSWAIGGLRNDYPDVLDKVGVAVLPTPDGNQEKPTASLGGWTLAVDGKSKYPKEAATFISWMLAESPDIMYDYFKLTAFSKFPARKAVDDAINSDPDAQKDEWRKLIAEKIVPYAVAEPIYAWEISIAYAHAIERVTLKNEDIEKSLQTAEKEINDYIKNNNYAGTNPNQQAQ